MYAINNFYNVTVSIRYVEHNLFTEGNGSLKGTV